MGLSFIDFVWNMVSPYSVYAGVFFHFRKVISNDFLDYCFYSKYYSSSSEKHRILWLNLYFVLHISYFLIIYILPCPLHYRKAFQICHINHCFLKLTGHYTSRSIKNADSGHSVIWTLRTSDLMVWGGTQESVFCFIFVLFFTDSCNSRLRKYCSTSLQHVKMLFPIFNVDLNFLNFLFPWNKFLLFFLFLSFFFFSWPCCVACEILVPWPGIKPRPQQWKHGVLTIGPQGNSLFPWNSFLIQP